MKIKSVIQSINPKMWAKFGTEIRNALVAIDAEDFTLVSKKLKGEFKKQGVEVTDEYLERGFFALKQYYAIAVIDRVNMHAVSDVIDPFWHMHILFSQNYCVLSNKMLGHYMHHDPLDHNDKEKLDFVHKLYTYTVEAYEKVFVAHDEAFLVPSLSNERLVCAHYGDSRWPGKQEPLFPVNEMLALYYPKYNYVAA